MKISAPLFLLFFFIVVQPVSAYIDPGMGSYVVQMAIAGVVSALYFIKLTWKRIRDFFARLFSRGVKK